MDDWFDLSLDEDDCQQITAVSWLCYWIGQSFLERAQEKGYSINDSPVSKLFVGFWILYEYFRQDSNKALSTDPITSKPLIDEVD